MATRVAAPGRMQYLIGHEIVLASSGREALARLAAEPVDLILSDLRMPDLDGPGLHRELAALASALARRVVFVTDDVLTPETDRFLGETGLPVLEKPLDPYDLRLKVRSYLAELGPVDRQAAGATRPS